MIAVFLITWLLSKVRNWDMSLWPNRVSGKSLAADKQGCSVDGAAMYRFPWWHLPLCFCYMYPNVLPRFPQCFTTFGPMFISPCLICPNALWARLKWKWTKLLSRLINSKCDISKWGFLGSRNLNLRSKSPYMHATCTYRLATCLCMVIHVPANLLHVHVCMLPVH